VDWNWVSVSELELKPKPEFKFFGKLDPELDSLVQFMRGTRTGGTS
jgi:hypothetical protein